MNSALKIRSTARSDRKAQADDESVVGVRRGGSIRLHSGSGIGGCEITGRTTLGVLIGPALVNFDLSIYKNFTFVERLKLRFRSKFFNLANHANFSNPASNISVPPQVGRITDTTTANRPDRRRS